MKKLVLALVGLLASTLLPSYGATKLATFKGFDSSALTQGTYTLDLNGNTVADGGSVTIASAPLILTTTNTSTWASNTGISILMKYSNLHSATNSSAALMTTYHSGNNTMTRPNSGLGCYVTTASKVAGIWNGVTWSGNTASSGDSVDDSGYLVLSYAGLVGTTVYYSDGTTVATAYTASGLKGGGYQIATPLCLGGTYYDALIATNLTIEGVAIYSGALSSDEITTAIADYANDHLSITEDMTVSAINTALASLGDGQTGGLRSIDVTAGVTIKVDAALDYAVTVNCDGDLNLAAATDVDASGTTTMAYDISGFDFSNVLGSVNYSYRTSGIASRAGDDDGFYTYGSSYSAGAGATNSAATASLVGGTMYLTGGTFYYNMLADYSTSDTATTIEMTDTARIEIADTSNDAGKVFRVGTATYNLSDNASIEATRFILSDGAAGRTSVFTMGGNSSVVVNGRGSTSAVSDCGTIDSNESDIMFGHWNGPSTFTIADSATFTATNSDVLVGLTSNTQIININGGAMTVQGIKTSTGASGSNTLNISGGTLNLGASGIDSHGTTTIPVAISGNATIGATDTTLPITQTLTFSSGATLSLSNVAYTAAVAAADNTADSVETVTVDVSNTISGTGTIALGPKVNLVLESDVRPDTSTLSIDMTDTSSALTVYLTNEAETPSFAITGDNTDSGVASRISVYITDGDQVASPTITCSDGVYTISTGVKVFNANAATVALGTTDLWDSTGAATDNENFNIKLSTDAVLTIDTDVTYGDVYVTNTADDDQTHTLTISQNFPASSLDLGDNVTLVFTNLAADTTLSTPITGSGSVIIAEGESVTFSGASTYTGGLTIETDAVVMLAGTTTTIGSCTAAGSGQLIITNATYVPKNTTATPFGVTFTDSAWTGTVTLRGVSRSNSTGAIYFNTLANSASTLELDGVSGYFANEHTATMKELRILKETPVTFDSNEYYGFHVNNGNGQHSATLTGKLTGDGPITLKKTQSGNMPRFCLALVGDATEWTGNVDMTENSSSTANYFRLSFAASSTYVFTSDTTAYDNYLSISRDVTISTWTLDTSDGKVAVATACNLNVTSNSTITASTMTFADGAQIVVTDTTTDTPATFASALTVNGTTTITGGSVKATSATYGSSVDTDSIVLASLDAELILTDSESEVTVGTTEALAAENYYVGCSKGSGTYRYHLRKPAFILSIR